MRISTIFLIILLLTPFAVAHAGEDHSGTENVTNTSAPADDGMSVIPGDTGVAAGVVVAYAGILVLAVLAFQKYRQ